MVLEELVRERKGEWKPAKVVLEGVAKELVQPQGQLEVTVGMGPGRSFTEEVLVVHHLPGDVQALVSFDTLKKVGLSVSAKEVLVGGEPVVLVGGVVRAEAAAVTAASVTAKGLPEGSGPEAKTTTEGAPVVTALEKARIATVQPEVACERSCSASRRGSARRASSFSSWRRPAWCWRSRRDRAARRCSRWKQERQRLRN